MRLGGLGSSLDSNRRSGPTTDLTEGQATSSSLDSNVQRLKYLNGGTKRTTDHGMLPNEMEDWRYFLVELV